MVTSRRRRRGSLLGACVASTLVGGWLSACGQPSAPLEQIKYPEPAITERITFANDVLTRVLARDYLSLDTLARELRSGKARFPGGEWKLRWFYVAFSQLGASRSWYPVPLLGESTDWNEVRSRLEEWRDQMPESITPRVALAQYWIAYAWEARGTAFANKVRDEQWALFEERLNESAKVLAEARRLEEKCPEWWFAAQRIALGQGWERRRVSKLMEEAVTFEPEYYTFYSALAYHFAPRWHGRPGDWNKEISRWIERLGAPNGDVVYARVLWALRDLGLTDEVFERKEVDWDRAVRGFVALRRQHPDSLEVVSMFAFLSGTARDRAQARALMASIGNRMDRGVWRNQKQFDSYRIWVPSR
ncbi:MAG TPA: DUF4034 domain-containing protein [Vicinamibacteria bacterium]|nr:DUF4034 domain-containing protein [Vicinamibacteria bacterium]